MPAPFVVAHLQVGLALTALGAALDSNESKPGIEAERPKIYITNACTGWEPYDAKPLPSLDLEQERDAADAIKQKSPILVIIGNPPYNGYAGVAESKEQRDLSKAYRKVKKVRKPEGQGLNDFYVRFFEWPSSALQPRPAKVSFRLSQITLGSPAAHSPECASS